MNEEPSKKPVYADPGEDMDVRHEHAAIWREEADPSEFMNRAPILLRQFYFGMLCWLIFYLVTWMGGWSWNEYEASPVVRWTRDEYRATPAPDNHPR
jgi:hypothetical protein